MLQQNDLQTSLIENVSSFLNAQSHVYSDSILAHNVCIMYLLIVITFQLFKAMEDDYDELNMTELRKCEATAVKSDAPEMQKKLVSLHKYRHHLIPAIDSPL